MKHKTWFRLVIKAIGVLLIVLSISPLIQALVLIIRGFIIGDPWTMYSPYGTTSSLSGASTDAMFDYAYCFLPASCQLAIGLYLLCGGKWLVNTCIPSNRPYCTECGYDLAGSKAEKCPECGVLIANPPRNSS